MNRYAVATLTFMALSVPLIVVGARGALRSTSNDPRQWLPREFEETDRYDWFRSRFGMDEMAVVSWPGCTLDDPRVERLAHHLEDSPLFQRVVTGPRVLDQLTSPPLNIPHRDAVRRLRGTLVGADGRTTCVVLAISPDGEADRTAAIEQIVDTAQTRCDLSADSLRMGGPTVDAVAIDAESRRLLFQLAGFSAVLSFLVACLRLKSLSLAMLVLVGAAYSTGLTLAVLYYTGGKMNLLMTMLPPLVYVLTISAAVHLVNYYGDAVRERGKHGAPTRAIAQGWWPCLLASATTAVGLFSLVTSKIEPIQGFGLYSAIGMLVSFAVLMVFLPAGLHFFPPKTRYEIQPAPAQNPPHRVARGSGFLSGIHRYHAPATAACLAVMVCFGCGLTRIDSTVKLQDRFLANSKIIDDYRWLEKHLGALVPLEVIVRFDQACPLTLSDRLKLVAHVEDRIQSSHDVDATMSAGAFATRRLHGRGVRHVAARTAFRRKANSARYLAQDDGAELWRISVRATALSQLDYGLFTESLSKLVDPLLADQPNGEISATYTGVIPLIYKAQRQLLNDLIRSFLTAFCVISVTMIVVMRSVWAGLVAMVPNLFPAVVIFGGMGWLGVLVQIGSVMTASAALGIAVDDTVHLLTWFRRGLNEGASRSRALRGALQRCAGAMIHTTLICGAGLSVFALSAFVPILHFAWIMVALLLAALVGDLILLPALLAGSFGRVFQHGTGPTSSNNRITDWAHEGEFPTPLQDRAGV